jgi:hypothetical protein
MIFFLIRHIFKIVVDSLSPIVISMCLKFREKITNPFALVNLIDDDFGIASKLFLFASNIKRNVCGVLDFFFFLKENLKKENFTTFYRLC